MPYVADGDGDGDGEGVGVGVACGRGGGPSSGPNGVANGLTGKVPFGASVLWFRGCGVTIAIAPFARAVTVASVFAGSTEPAPITKFLPLRKICQSG